MKTINFEFQELLNFIIAQPDERKIEMMANTSESCYGCVLIQFGRTKLKGGFIAFFRSIKNVVYDENQERYYCNDGRIENLIDLYLKQNVKNYREAKELLNFL